jgi:amino acid transporter
MPDELTIDAVPTPSHPSAAQHRLAKDSVGVLGIIFFVVAAAAPLTVVVALFPVIVATGNGIGIAGTFLLVAIVLLLFSVGYVAMSRHITNAGAFYSYISHGLNPTMGLASATLVIFSYNAIQLGLYGGIGHYAQQFFAQHLAINLPWWTYAFAAMAACLALGLRRLEAGAMLLMVLLSLETGIIVLLDGGIVLHGLGAHAAATGAGAGAAVSAATVTQFSLAPFSLHAMLSGSLGVALMFAHASFIGFEGTAIYGEEARDPKTSIPRATYASVLFMGIFYSVTAYLIVSSLGLDQVVAIARRMPAGLIFVVSDAVLGHWGTALFEVFVISSLFAAILTFHNNVSRYLFALGRQGLFHRALGNTHAITRSPHIACYFQTLMVGLVVGVFAIAQLDPYDTLFTWFTGIGAAGIIIVQCIASIAIYNFFRRHPVDLRRWNTIVAPLLGIAGLLGFLYVALTSLDVLTGATGLVQWILMGLLIGSIAIGLGMALWLKRARPAQYATLVYTLSDQS